MAGLYIHIPFCESRCIYCDFYSTTRLKDRTSYVNALIRELKFRAGYLPHSAGHLPPIHTIYFGGGTPSQLNCCQLEQILNTIYKEYDVSNDAEITLEANPDDLSEQRIKELRKLPFNRLSMGIQTFDDKRLHFLKRRHNGKEAIEAVKRCQDAGLTNISIDLIYGLPQETLSEWEEDITLAISLHTPHISGYALIYEEGTPLWKMKEKELVKEIEDETSLAMYSLLIDCLTADGFEHYEISNFARPGFRSRHNSSYWMNIPYLGCGPSAHSFDGLSRQWNTPDLTTYINMVNACQSPTDFFNASWIEKEELSLSTRYNDFILTSLRTCWGADIHIMKEKFGDKLTAYCLRMAKPYLDSGHMILTKQNEQAPEGLLKLTRRGLFLSDGIISDLLYVED